MSTRRYTTERGITIGITPIPLLLDKIREAHPMPDPPTYTEHTAGGGVQEVEITEAMAATWAARDPSTWAQHKETWAEYQAETDRRTTILNDALWRAVMRRAIQVDMPKDDAWAEDQALYGLTVPDDPAERREHYIWTEVLGGQRDILKVMGLAAGADLTEDQLEAVGATFWDTLQRPQAGGPADQGGAVDAGAPGDLDANGEGVGATAQQPRTLL